ncbi:MAG: hypothetical protein H0W72_05355 [Planctomycetes bacterium]|nr:hypothetical protein [Planctomycetota bacterium]
MTSVAVTVVSPPVTVADASTAVAVTAQVSTVQVGPDLGGDVASTTVTVTEVPTVVQVTEATSGDVVISETVTEVVVSETTASGNTLVAEVAFGDATPASIFSVPDGYRLSEIEIDVLEAFNGTGAAVLLGTVADPALHFTATDSDLAALGNFSKQFTDAGPIAIRHTITPGAGATTGRLLIRAVITDE